jgi:hypothetical protein
MLGKLSMIGAVAAILVIPTALSARRKLSKAGTKQRR